VEILQAIRQDNIHRPFSLQTDLCLLEEKLRALGDVRLIEIDPISAYFGGSKKADSHNDVDVRTVLAPVTDMANRLDVAILSIQHFNKSSGGIHAKALHKFMGSIAFVAGPRMAFAIVEDSDNALRRLFLHVKNNLAPPPPGLAFQIEQAALVDYGMSASRIAWEAGTVNITADEAISAVRSKDVAPALEEAKQFLASLVGQESMSAKQIEKEAKEAGLSWATVRRAKDELGYKSVKAGLDDGWVWKR
jgi:putative DNA primase/helicase